MASQLRAVALLLALSSSIATQAHSPASLLTTFGSPLHSQLRAKVRGMFGPSDPNATSVCAQSVYYSCDCIYTWCERRRKVHCPSFLSSLSTRQPPPLADSLTPPFRSTHLLLRRRRPRACLLEFAPWCKVSELLETSLRVSASASCMCVRTRQHRK
jgi:hypothetical protein